MISATLLILSCGLLGIFLGAQIAEAVLLVPYWKDLSPDDFFQLHKTYGKKIYAFFSPLTIGATIIPLLTVIDGILQQSEEQMFFLIMGGATLLFFSTYFIFFKKANQNFAERTIGDQELKNALVTWGNWHWTRITFESIAFGISLFLLFKV